MPSPICALFGLMASAFPGRTLVKWRAIAPVGCHFCIAYGQTEGYASQWFVPPARVGDGALPVGYLLPGQRYAIVDDAGNSVAPGEVGELIIRSPYVALGVWQDGRCKPGGARPDASDPDFRVLSTGDLAHIDGDSLLRIVGRRDRQVKIRGQRRAGGNRGCAVDAASPPAVGR